MINMIKYIKNIINKEFILRSVSLMILFHSVRILVSIYRDIPPYKNMSIHFKVCALTTLIIFIFFTFIMPLFYDRKEIKFKIPEWPEF